MLYTDERAIIETEDIKRLENSGNNLGNKQTKVENIENVITNNPNLTKLLCLIGGNNSALEKIIKKINKLEGIEPSVICNYLCKTEVGMFESKYIDIVAKRMLSIFWQID